MKVFGGEKEEKVLLYHPEKFQTILLIIEKGWHLVISLKFCLTRLDKKKVQILEKEFLELLKAKEIVEA